MQGFPQPGFIRNPKPTGGGLASLLYPRQFRSVSSGFFSRPLPASTLLTVPGRCRTLGTINGPGIPVLRSPPSPSSSSHPHAWKTTYDRGVGEPKPSRLAFCTAGPGPPANPRGSGPSFCPGNRRTSRVRYRSPLFQGCQGLIASYARGEGRCLSSKWLPPTGKTDRAGMPAGGSVGFGTLVPMLR